MRKKAVLIILIFIIGCCYSFAISYASTPAIVFLSSNQEELEKGEEIEITVHIERVKTVAFDFSLYFDDTKLDFISRTDNSNVIDNRILLVWYDDTGGKQAKEGELAKFRFRAKEEGLATFSIEGKFYNENAQLIETGFKEKQVKIGKKENNLQKQSQEVGNDFRSNNSNLQALRLDKEGVTPSFNKEIKEYFLTVSNEIQDIEVLAVTENPKATVEVIGNTNLKEGLNIISIHVISEDKTQNNVYTIEVTKTSNLELANTNLEILAIENALLNPPFDVSETNYKIEVSNQTDSIHVFAVPENEQAKVEIRGADNLKEGNNLVKILVIAPNGFTKKDYEVEVYKRNLEEEKSYQEEVAKQKENLENAYKIQETSTNLNQKQEIATTEQSKKYENIFGYVVVLVGILLGVLALLWRKKYKKR